MKSLPIRWKYTILRVITDALIAPITVVIAYCLKFKIGWFFQNVLSLQFGEIYQQAQIEPYIAEFGMIILIWLSTFYFVGMYRQKSGIMPEVDEWVCIVKGLSVATIELMAFTFVYKSFPGSRFVIAYMWAIGIGLLIVARTLIFQYELRALRNGKGNKRAIIFGDDESAHDLIEKIILFPTLGLVYIGSITEKDNSTDIYTIKGKLKTLGTPDHFDHIIHRHKPDVVVVTDTKNIDHQTIRNKCISLNIELLVLPPDGDIPTSIARIDEFDSIPVYHYYPYTPNKTMLALKSIYDRILALIGLIVLSPVLLVIAILIKKVSPNGPILFRQERLGLNGKPFNMIKFRTMIPDAEAATGPVMVNLKGDHRYIKYGDFLRKTSLDELPQLINVLCGDMSLVGPRPERPHFAAQFSKNIPHFPLRLLVKGGITGWAQINGRSALTSRPEYKIKYDLYYIKNWTLVLDIKILLKTIWIVFRREEAY